MRPYPSLFGNRENGSDQPKIDFLLFSLPPLLPHDVLGLDSGLPVFGLLQSRYRESARSRLLSGGGLFAAVLYGEEGTLQLY